MRPRQAIRTLVGLALGLPIVVLVLTGARSLLTGMGDAGGAAMIGYVSLVCQVLWAIDLVGLLIVLALVALDERSEEEE